MEEAAIQLLKLLISENSIKINEKYLLKLENQMLEYTRFLPSSIATLDDYINNENEDNIINNLLYGRIVNAFNLLFETDAFFNNKKLQLQIENIFVVEGSNVHMLNEVLIFISKFLKKSRNEKSVEFLISMLEKILKSDAVFSSIISACRKEKINEIETKEYEAKFKEFIQILVSLPMKVSNKLKGRISEIFYLHNFSKIISFHVVRAISFLCKSLDKREIHFNPGRISTIISKMLLHFKSENFSTFTRMLICLSLENPDGMTQLIPNILLNIERQSIESIAILLLKNIENPNDIEKIFGNILENDSWKYILTTKILFLSYYKDNKLIFNLVTYLSRKYSKKLFIELIMKLLDIWGDKSALKHTSFDQHEFITKIILFTIKKIGGRLEPAEKDSIQKLLFSGTSAHLEHMQLNIRALGMITGELIVDCLREPDAPKLKYDYGSMPKEGQIRVNKLRKFWTNEYENFEDSSIKTMKYEELIENLNIEIKNLSKINEETRTREWHVLNKGTTTDENNGIIKCREEEISKGQITQTSNSERKEFKGESDLKNNADDTFLDSDDDDFLIPYDMSNDKKLCETLRPTYLRDLKENLTNLKSNNDPDIFSESLKCSEHLISSQLPNDDASFAMELLHLFFKLTQIFYVENFDFLKFRACVCITKIYPKESTEFLCREFHAKIGDNSISDRLFCLNVLSEAAKELSKINVKKETSKEEQTTSQRLKSHERKHYTKPISLLLNLEIGKKFETLYDDNFEIVTMPEINKLKFDENVITQRIKLNTRVFNHTSNRPSITTNIFNSVAAYFFYPLLYGLRMEERNIFYVPKYFEYEGNILLINFLKALSTIMIAAENCVIAPKMGRDMLEIAWNLRYHQQAGVRYCVIECIAAVIIAVPKDNFTFEMIELLLELRIWLENIAQETIKGDPCAKSRAMAKNVMSLVHYNVISVDNPL